MIKYIKFIGCVAVAVVSVFALYNVLIQRLKTSPKLRLQSNKEFANVELPLKGKLPSWLKGSLVRNCTVPVYEAGKEQGHYFDGIAMLHSFKIEDGTVSYSSRYLESEAYSKIIQSDTEFYQRTIDSKTAKNIHDAGVNVFKYNKSYVALTETPLPVWFDVETLETLGNFEFQDELPKKGVFESAHPHYCEDSKELFNFLIDFGKKTHYVFYRMVENSSRREVIARIPVNKPGYMHSFAMTEHYLILVEFPLVVNPLRLLFAQVSSFASYIRLFKWLPEQGTRFLVVEKSTGKLVMEQKTEPLFSFHHANAYEKGGEVVIDLIAHNFPDLADLLPQAAGSAETVHGLLRFHLSVNEQQLSYEKILDKQTEFPRVPDRLDGKPYRYLYMVNYATPHPSLLKYDWEQKKETSWIVENTTVIEPAFVPALHVRSEDEGVLLTVAHDHAANSSYLLVLDAQSLKEIARATLPEPLPRSFHGQFF